MENQTRIEGESEATTEVISSSGDIAGDVPFIQREVEGGVHCAKGKLEGLFACLKEIPSFAAALEETDKLLTEKDAMSRELQESRGREKEYQEEIEELKRICAKNNSQKISLERNLKISEERAVKQKKMDEATIRDKQEEIENLKISLKSSKDEKEVFEQQVRKLEEEKRGTEKKFGELQNNLTEERRESMTYKVGCSRGLQDLVRQMAMVTRNLQIVQKFASEGERGIANVLPSTPPVYSRTNPEVVVAEADPRLAKPGTTKNGGRDSSLKELQLSHMQTSEQDGSSHTKAAENSPNGTGMRLEMTVVGGHDPCLTADINENGKRRSSLTMTEQIEAARRRLAEDKTQVQRYDQMQRSGEGGSGVANVLPSNPPVYSGTNPEVVVAGADPRLAKPRTNENGRRDGSLREPELSHMQTSEQDGSSHTKAAKNSLDGISTSSFNSGMRPEMEVGGPGPRPSADINENGKRSSSLPMSEQIAAAKRRLAEDRTQVQRYDQMRRSRESANDRTAASGNILESRQGHWARSSSGGGKWGSK